MKSPIRWLGGKGQWAETIVDLLPPHHTYVEPFGGGASVLFAKAPSLVEVYNDIDSSLVNFFRVLRDPDQFERFRRLVESTPFSRQEFYECRDHELLTDDPVERARRWFVITRQNFGGNITTWGMSLASDTGGMATTNRQWLNVIERLPEIHARLMRVQIEHRSWEQVVNLYDSPATLFYLDPPYIPETRSTSGKYRHELSGEDHRRLVARLLSIEGKALLSGYPHPAYAPLEDAGWVRRMQQRYVGITGGSASAAAAVADGRLRRTDTIWISPSATTQTEIWEQSAWETA